MTPDTEELLLEYLRDQRAADVKGSLDRLHNLFLTHDADDKIRHGEILGLIRGHSLRIGALEKNDDKLEARVEQSGSWHLEDLKTKAHERGLLARNWPSVLSALVAAVALIVSLWKGGK